MRKIIFAVLCIAALCALVIPAAAEVTTEAGLTADVEPAYNGLVDAITSSSLWISIGTYASAAIAVLALVKSKFGHLVELVSKKADTDTLKKAVSSSAEEIKDAFVARLDEVNAALASETENRKKMEAVLAIFILNTKLSTSARAEIMELLSGMKEMTGTVQEIVEAAEAAIEKAEAEKEKPSTPALDKITYMDLG